MACAITSISDITLRPHDGGSVVLLNEVGSCDNGIEQNMFGDGTIRRRMSWTRARGHRNP